MSVRHALLGLLSQSPSHGYELRDAFETLAGGRALWEVKPAQIYTTLARLEDAGLVAQTAAPGDGGPDRRVYEITESGREELLGWYAGGVHAEHHRDEFFLKLVLALSSADVDAHEILRVQRSTLYRDLHELTARRAGLSLAGDLTHAMLLDKAIMHAEADIRWLEMVEARLTDMARQPMRLPKPKRRGRPPKRAEGGSDPDPPVSDDELIRTVAESMTARESTDGNR